MQSRQVWNQVRYRSSVFTKCNGNTISGSNLAEIPQKRGLPFIGNLIELIMNNGAAQWVSFVFAFCVTFERIMHDRWTLNSTQFCFLSCSYLIWRVCEILILYTVFFSFYIRFQEIFGKNVFRNWSFIYTKSQISFFENLPPW